MTPADKKNQRIGSLKGWLSLSPVVVFLLLYLVLSLIIGDFYKIPISVALAIACIWAIASFSGHSLTERRPALRAPGPPDGRNLGDRHGPHQLFRLQPPAGDRALFPDYAQANERICGETMKKL